MQTSEIEAWVLRVIDLVDNGQSVEDSRVELKSVWPRPQEAARRIAGHCNSVRDEHVLWLIGVDEKMGVVGADRNEFSSWWAQARSEFDGLSPGVIDLVVPSNSKSVSALLFDATRRPFVVKNPQAGKVKLEVPWREATAIRSARREDLIRLLSPIQKTPEFELLKGELFARISHSERPGKNTFSWSLSLYGYLYATVGCSFTVPFHTADGHIAFPELALDLPFDEFGVQPTTQDLDTMQLSAGQLSISGPGSVTIWAHAEGGENEVATTDRAEAWVTLRSRDLESPIAIRASFRYVQEDLSNEYLGTWKVIVP